MVVAPHVLYTRRGDYFFDGVALEKNGLTPLEYKLGTFKLAGLRDLVPSSRPSEAGALYIPSAAKYQEPEVAVVVATAAA